MKVIKFLLLSVFVIFSSCKKGETELKPVANFSALIIEFGDVTFRNKSFNATEYLWDFGDGNTSTEKDPIHSYLEIGDYTVTLTVSDGVNSDMFSLLVVIGQVFPSNLTQLTAPPFGQRAEGFSFCFNGKGYVGGGYRLNPSFQNLSDFWEFNPIDKEWSFLNDQLPGNFRNSIAYVANNSAFFGLGSGAEYTIYEYDFVANSVIPSSNLPFSIQDRGPFSSAKVFVYDDIPYLFGIGDYEFSNPDKTIWKYNVTNNEWSSFGNYQGEGLSGLFHFFLEDKLIIGMGLNYGDFYYQNDIWEYDFTNNTWTQKNNFPGGGRINGIGFTYNGEGYFGFGQGIDPSTNLQVFFSDLWKYNSNDDSWEKIEDFPVRTKSKIYAFLLNDALYFGGGIGSDFQLSNSFFEYQF